MLDATIDLVLERHREVLKRGAVLVDPNDLNDQPRLLFYLDHSICDGRETRHGKPHIISRQLQFVEVKEDGTFIDGGAAPYLDYHTITPSDLELVSAELDADWLKKNWEDEIIGFTIANVTPKHLEEIKKRKLPLIDKVEHEVQARLKKEINYWDRRYEDLKAKEQAGKRTRLPAQQARDRADRLADRLQSRLALLDRERAITAQPPVITGGALIIPGGLLHKIKGDPPTEPNDYGTEGRVVVERLAMEAVFDAEKAMGREPRDVHTQRGIGYDIESKDPKSGELFFIEVKGRAAHADQVSLTRTEILCALNEPEKFRLAVVRINDGAAEKPVYVMNYDYGQPGFEQTSATYPLNSILAQGRKPS